MTAAGSGKENPLERIIGFVFRYFDLNDELVLWMSRKIVPDPPTMPHLRSLRTAVFCSRLLQN